MATDNRKISKACRGCTHKCLATHSNWALNSNGLSFFKVMVGDFSSFLEIPLENQIQNQNFKIAILEGPSGHLWHVILCYTNARASFKDGWENFVSFHSIQAQDTLVFRHVIDTYFSVQIFGSNGSEKQSTFTVDKCRSHCLKEETPFPNCKERKSDDEKTAKSFLCISISSDAEKDTNKDTNVDILTTSLNESSSCNIAKIGVTPSKRKKVHTVKAAHAETNMFSGRPVSSNNHVPLNASKTNTKDTVELNKLNLDALRNLVGWTAEMPIILDAEEEVNAQCSHGHKHDRVKVKACEILQEESSLCSTAFARTKKYADTEKQRKFKLATKKRDQCLGQNYSFDTSLTMCVDDLENFMSSKTNKPKFSVVMRKTAVSKCYWLNFPLHFVKRWLPQKNIDVLLLRKTAEWRTRFIGDSGRNGLRRGWRHFAIDNKLVEGDTCVFQLINRKSLIFKVDIFRVAKQNNPSKKKKVAK